MVVAAVTWFVYFALVNGRIDLTSYLFTRHVDHFHALIYALSAIEFRWLAGAFILTRIIGAASAVGTAAIIAGVAISDAKSRPWLLSGLACEQPPSTTKSRRSTARSSTPCSRPKALQPAQTSRRNAPVLPTSEFPCTLHRPTRCTPPTLLPLARGRSHSLYPSNSC